MSVDRLWLPGAAFGRGYCPAVYQLIALLCASALFDRVQDQLMSASTNNMTGNVGDNDNDFVSDTICRDGNINPPRRSGHFKPELCVELKYLMA